MRPVAGLFLTSALAAFAAPWTGDRTVPTPPPPHFPGWPALTRPLTQVPLNDQERTWQASFPGRIARFESGDGRTLLVRWVYRPTRKLHPSRDCYRGLGHQVDPRSALRDESGRHWSRFVAVSPEGTTHTVSELIQSESGPSYPDVQAWYWSAARGEDPGPWWAYTWSHRGAS